MEYKYVEITENDREAKRILDQLDTVSWDADLALYKISTDDLALYPELRRMRVYTQDGVEKRKKNISRLYFGLMHTRDEELELSRRFYIDLEPQELYKWIVNPKNGFRFDVFTNKWYCNKDLASTGSYEKNLSKCLSKKRLTALDIDGRKPTMGKSMLAAAINEPDFAKRQIYVALALDECAKEKALGVEGAIQSYNDIVKAFEKGNHKIGFRESYKTSRNFYNSVAQYKNAKSMNALEFEKRLDDAQKESLNVLLTNAASRISDHNEVRLRTLGKSGRDYNELVGAVRNIMRDQLVLNSALAYANYASNKRNDLFDIYEAKFNSNVNDFLSYVDTANFRKGVELNSDDTLSFKSQILTMKELSIQYGRNIEKRCNDLMSAKKGESISPAEFEREVAYNYGDVGNIEKAFQRTDLASFRKMGEKPFEVDYSVELSGDKKPLYLIIDYEDRKNLAPELKNELRTDPYNNALCVEDSEKNRKLFAKFIPDAFSIEKFNKYAQSLKEDIRTHLEELGATFNKGEDVIIDYKSHKIGDLMYKVYTFDTGCKLQVFDQKTQEQHEFKLGVETNAEYQKLVISDILHAMAVKNAKEMEQRNENAEYINKVFTNDDMLKITDAKFEFPYFKKTKIPVSEIGGYIDNKGAFQGYVFVNDKNTVQTNTTVFCPMYNTSGKIISAMAIADNGKQEFIKGVPTKGTFSVAGKYNIEKPKDLKDKLGKAEVVIVTVDPVSAAAIAKYAPDNTVVVSANTTENLKYVAQNIAKNYPNAGIAIFGENNVQMSVKGKENYGVHEAEHTARIVMSQLRPMCKAYHPPLTMGDLANGLSSFADVYRSDPERLQNYVIAACVETASNYSAVKHSREFESRIFKDLISHTHSSSAQKDINREEVDMSTVNDLDHNLESIKFDEIKDSKKSDPVKNFAQMQPALYAKNSERVAARR